MFNYDLRARVYSQVFSSAGVFISENFYLLSEDVSSWMQEDNENKLKQFKWLMPKLFITMEIWVVLINF